MIDHAIYIRVEPIKEIVPDARITLTELFTEKQISFDNRVIDSYLERTTESFNEDRYERL